MSINRFLLATLLARQWVMLLGANRSRQSFLAC
jgi:hypothetical protein